MAGAFQESAFQYSGFQMDAVGPQGGGWRPHHGGIVEFLMARPMRRMLPAETVAEIGRVAESAEPDLSVLLAGLELPEQDIAQELFVAYRAELIRKRRITAAYLLAAAS